ncbi:MAG: hypothetical protein R2874_09165 [Desulfobacterales bacterium]
MKLDAFPQTVQIIVDTPVNVHRSSPIVWFCVHQCQCVITAWASAAASRISFSVRDISSDGNQNSYMYPGKNQVFHSPP